ncbi:MAG: hypothetical protein VX836_08110 [Pseudomonadota bacterium]|nr:hypothetical protein [Pseudomonadota bacterium]
MSLKSFLRAALCSTVCLAVLACSTDDEGSGGLLDADDPSGSGSSLVLTIEGSDGASSGQVTVEAGDIAEGFVATLKTGSGKVVKDRFIALTPDQGFVNAPPSNANTGGDNTDSSGEVEFDYQAPDTVTAARTIDLVASVELTSSEGGGTLEEEFQIKLTKASAPTLVITGPKNVAPGVTNAGYRVTVTKASGAQVPQACVTLRATSGTITPPAETTCSETGLTGYTTTDAGIKTFSYRPPASGGTDSVVNITAETTIGGTSGSAVYQVNILPDTFQFTSPAENESVFVGIDSKERLRFQWTRDSSTQTGSSGVSSSVKLSTDSNRALFVVNNAITGSATITATTSASNSGDFSEPVYIYSNNSGQVEVQAEDEATGQEATLLVNFVDGPTQINLDATPLIVNTSPNAGRFSNLEVTLLNGAGQPIEGVEVEFLLLQAAGTSVNERVFPEVQVTNESGEATSRYEAGPTEGAAQVRVRAENGALSNIREITVAEPEEE